MYNCRIILLCVLETIQGKYTIKQILKDNWEDFSVTYRPLIRENVIAEINKVMACKDIDILGYSVYVCKECDYRHKVGNTCKSRFCNSCGKKMTDDWIVKASTSFLNVPYHHVVFSPPSELWLLFATYRECLHFLFRAANESVSSWCKEQGFVPGVTEVLHTFGSTLEWHPHIHMLLSEGGIREKSQFDFSVWHECGFFPEKVLKERFKYHLIKSLRDFAMHKSAEGLFAIPETIKNIWHKKFSCRDFYRITVELYKIIWYVYIGEKLTNARFTTRYIGRYAKRPCLSEAKIVYYSYTEQTVRFSYHDKMTKTDMVITLSVNDFLKRLIRHIPEKGFRMIRYYGIYANRIRTEMVTFLLPQIMMLFGIAQLTYEPIKTWRERMREFIGVDPLLCPNCGIKLTCMSITYPSRDGPFKTVYF